LVLKVDGDVSENRWLSRAENCVAGSLARRIHGRYCWKKSGRRRTSACQDERNPEYLMLPAYWTVKSDEAGQNYYKFRLGPEWATHFV
jgi:hypothetical protein